MWVKNVVGVFDVVVVEEMYAGDRCVYIVPH